MRKSLRLLPRLMTTGPRDVGCGLAGLNWPRHDGKRRTVVDAAVLGIAATVVLGFVAGFVVRRLGVPAGGLIGPFFAVAAFSVLTGLAWLPSETRIVVQIVAGAFVGCSIQRDELGALKHVAKPALLMLGWYLLFVLGLGFLLYAVTPLSLPTALMSCVPGGISDVPIVAAGMGASTPDVTLLQLARLVLGMTLLYVAAKAGNRAEGRKPDKQRGKRLRRKIDETAVLADNAAIVTEAAPVRPAGEGVAARGADAAVAAEEPSRPRSGLIPEMGPEASDIDRPDPTMPKPTRLRLTLQLLATLAVATVGGLAGYATGIPGMTFTAAIAVTLAFNLATGFTFMPKWLKRLVQYTAGTYLGTQVVASDLAGIAGLVGPAAIVLLAYTASFFALGALMQRLFGFTKTEGRLIAVPAGAADIALVLEDLGIRNTNVVLLQIVRLIAVLALFPQVINVILWLAS